MLTSTSACLKHNTYSHATELINNGIRIWLLPSNDQLTWDTFLHCLNQWGTLHWTCDGHVNSLIFLELQISIGSDRHLIFQTKINKPVPLHTTWLSAS
jgi:hypothetical protein